MGFLSVIDGMRNLSKWGKGTKIKRGIPQQKAYRQEEQSL
jgi:hypothetical protein